MDVHEVNLFYSPKDRLRLTVGDRLSYITVKPVWASPLARPDEYLALLDGKGNEITTIADLSDLPENSWKAVQAELRLRYLTAVIKIVHSARQEFGATYWNVCTDRGDREFVTQSLQENALWYSSTHLLLLDTDGNRFEIPSLPSLDSRSQSIIAAIV